VQLDVKFVPRVGRARQRFSPRPRPSTRPRTFAF